MTLPWYSDVRQRQLRPEQMDCPDLDEVEHRSALRGIARVNALSFTDRKFWEPIRRLAKGHAPLRVLDVACGDGEIAIRLAQMARRTGLDVSIDGCDISPAAITFARERALHAGVECRFFQFDVTSQAWPDDYDVITTSLFLHHLTSETAVNVLRAMAKSARQMVLVNDLVRSRTGYILARFGIHLLSRSPMVHFDGPVSVAGAFTPREIEELAREAGLKSVAVTRIWPSRMLLEWHRW
jgi:2-polyprenyl-3-methyl-5-hydroxy-6-metoxy-1,4-benzoquinol methylase